MLGNIGPTTLVLIIVIALLIFGPSKLPELGRAFGRTLREFKKGASEIMSDDDQPSAQERKSVGNQGSAGGSNTQPLRESDARRLPD